MYNEAITLVAETQAADEYGYMRTVTTSRTVFAKLMSIGMTEFYQAQAVGVKPEIKFVIPDYLEYQGEEKILYAPYQGSEEEYRILRTYRNGNELEITCYRGNEE